MSEESSVNLNDINRFKISSRLGEGGFGNMY